MHDVLVTVFSKILQDIIISKLNRDDFLLSLEQMVDRQTISEPAEVLRNAGLELDRTQVVKQTAEEAVYSRLDVQNIAYINLLVVTIIATVTFSAAIQVPGGYDSEGVVILSKKEDFRTFMIYDSMAFGFSVLSMFIHFLAAFFTKFTSIAYPIMCVFMSTVLSLLSTFFAFVQGTQAVLAEKSRLATNVNIVTSVLLSFFIPFLYFCLCILTKINK